MKFQSSSLRSEQFSDMELSPALMAALAKMDITAPTEVQRQAIPAGLSGADLITVAQTGSGKTLAFALPVLTAFARRPASRALILAPSREMAMQIFKVFETLCAEAPVTACLVIGGLPGNKQNSQLKKNPRLIVATPGRMNDLLSDNKLLLKNVDMVVIDEADRMLDLGFAPQLKDIQATMRGERQTLMFSASFGPAVEAIAKIFMGPEVTLIRSAQAETPVASLKQKVLLLSAAMKHDRLQEELRATQGGVIIFAGSQENCENVGRHVKGLGHSVDLIHGALSQGHRSRVIRDFRDGKFRILVATDLLARGLDVPSVEHVINYDLPFEAEDFLHRIGRTARAGRAGAAVTFVTPADLPMYERIKPYLQGAEETKLYANFDFPRARTARDSLAAAPRRDPRQRRGFRKKD